VIAFDTNVLVYGHRGDSPFHRHASKAITEAAESPNAWAIPWPCLHEFYAIVTHARIYAPPSTPAQALAQIDAWLESPSLRLLTEDATYMQTWSRFVTTAGITGGAVHDARVAALCLTHGVRTLVTLDRDFGRFPDLPTTSLLG
jgi:hypothetical protein